MTQITIIRSGRGMPNESSLAGARTLLFETFDGLSHDDKRSWRHAWRRIIGLKPGGIAKIEIRIPRNSRFHRKFFALLDIGFHAWSPPRKHKTYRGLAVKKDFEQFREDITIFAGFYEQTFGLDGRLRLKAKSISFQNMEEPEFERLYNAVADTLLDRVLHRYKNRTELDNVVNQVLGFL